MSDKQSEEYQQKLSEPMPTLRQAFDLRRKMLDRFGPDFGVVVKGNPETGYVCHAMKNGHYPTPESVGDNDMTVPNEFFWDVVK